MMRGRGPRMRIAALAAAALAVALAATRTPAQVPPVPPAENDPVEMMRTVAREMRKAEELLLKAQAAEEARAAAEQAVRAIDKLLDEAKKSQSEVISSLDKLIEEVRKRQQEKQGGQSSQSRRQPRREPPKPRPEDQEKDPKFKNRPDREQPQRKRGPMDKQKTDQPPPKSPQEQAQHASKDGVWGRLPDKLFKLITNRDQTVFPAEFQAYIEEYFKRLAETKSP